MVEVKKRLKCKDFKYFLKEAYPECWVNQLVRLLSPVPCSFRLYSAARIFSR